jgi:trk system potassium uptake protein TrkA
MTKPEEIPGIRQLVGKADYEDVHNVIIMGGGKTSIRAALIMPDNMRVKIIERDAARCEFINHYVDRNNAMVIHGDGRDLSLLEEEGIRHTQAFVALTGNAETNILACLAAKKKGVRKTVAMVENLDYVPMAESLDIGTIINKKTVAASHIFQMMLRADVRNLRTLMLADCEVAELVATEGSRITRKKVKELGLHSGVTIGGLVRDGHGFLVNGNTQIQAGDSVLVFCHKHNLEKIEKYFKRLSIW